MHMIGESLVAKYEYIYADMAIISCKEAISSIQYRVLEFCITPFFPLASDFPSPLFVLILYCRLSNTLGPLALERHT